MNRNFIYFGKLAHFYVTVERVCKNMKMYYPLFSALHKGGSVNDWHMSAPRYNDYVRHMLFYVR